MTESEVKRIELICKLSKIEWTYRSSRKTIIEVMYIGKNPLYFSNGFKVSKGLFNKELSEILHSEYKTITQIKTYETKNGSIEFHYHEYDTVPMYYVFRYRNIDGVLVKEKSFITE